MKKIIIVFLLLTPLLVFAQEEIPNECEIDRTLGVEECDEKMPAGADFYPCNVDDDPVCGLCCLLDAVYTLTNWIFFLMMALAVILAVFGGFTYMTAGGDPSKAGKGKTIIMFAIVGLAIALVARFIPPVVKFIMGVS